MNKHKRYIDRKRVYSGHYSDVYRCVDSETESVVCLKIVDCDVRMKPHDIHREISILKRCSHPNILQLKDDYEWQDDIVLVSEFYTYDLRTLLQQSSVKSMKHNFEDPSKSTMVLKNTLAEAGIEKMLLRLGEALVYLHNNGIIHRDIKPSNIFFKGAIENPVLGDFGISYEGELGLGEENLGHTKSRGVTTSIENISQTPFSPSFSELPSSSEITESSPSTLSSIVDKGMLFNSIDRGANSFLMPDEPPHSKFTDVCTGIYKPPELCLGVVDYSYEIDIWALGVVMTVLYSRSLRSVLEPQEGDEGVVNDIYLLNAIFNNFGTPTLEPDQPLSWPEMNSDKYHFKNFQFVQQPRKPTAVLLPRCTNTKVRNLFDSMMTYDRGKRVTAKQLVEWLET